MRIASSVLHSVAFEHAPPGHMTKLYRSAPGVKTTDAGKIWRLDYGGSVSNFIGGS